MASARISTSAQPSANVYLLDGIDEQGEISLTAKAAVQNELRGQFRPEFLNRLDEVILFKPLIKSDIEHIIMLLLEDLNKRLADRDIRIELTGAAKLHVVENAYDPIYGARPLKRYLQKHVETLSAKLILADEVEVGQTIVIDCVDKELTAYVK